MGLAEWIMSGLLLAAAGLNIYLLLRKPKYSGRDSLLEMRNEINNTVISSLKDLGDFLSNTQTANNTLLRESLDSQHKHTAEANRTFSMETEQKLENIRVNLDKALRETRETIENSLVRLQNENSKKLDEIRHTVDDKLQTTLENRITKSFELVNSRLEEVYKGLGEMRNLADGVGDLKRVLANVKTRGILGEIQLGNILEQILAPDQYERDFQVKKGSKERVEFAVKLPGDELPVYLPIDAKFPLEDYRRLLAAYDTVDPEAIESAKKSFERTIIKSAQTISEKYIDVPSTTEFAIMFLPIESLYAEVLKLDVVEKLQKEYRINVAGPSTMAALLNSLHMGFRTLALQKHSSEVWRILGAVKTEFETFGKVLKETQQRISLANDNLDRLVGVRTRQIQRKLKNVASLSEIETKVLLPQTDLDDKDDDE